MMKSISILSIAVLVAVNGFSYSAVWCKPSRHSTVQSSRSMKVASSVDEVSSSQDDPAKLIELTKEFLADGNGFYSKPKSEWFADDFAFQGEILGPMNKEGYIRNLEGFKLYEAFPDIQPNPSSFVMDSINPRRVWFLVRVTGTHLNSIPLRFLPWAPPIQFKATGAKVRGGPEAFSVTWDRNNKVKFLTVGYAVSQEGTNGGFGAAFGLLHACGVEKGLLKLVHDNIEPVLAVNQFAGRLDDTMPLARAYDGVVARDIPWWSQYEKTGEIPL